jgi:hypothetical protein
MNTPRMMAVGVAVFSTGFSSLQTPTVGACTGANDDNKTTMQTATVMRIFLLERKTALKLRVVKVASSNHYSFWEQFVISTHHI